MSGDLGNLLTGELGEAEARFSHEDFAADYGQRIAGRVRRRRAVRAAGVGGGTMLTAGALAVGAMNIPWGTLGAEPGVGGSDCATPWPSVTVATYSVVIDTDQGSLTNLTIMEAATGAMIVGGVRQADGTYLFTDGYGDPLAATPGVAGLYTVSLPPGVTSLESTSTDAYRSAAVSTSYLSVHTPTLVIDDGGAERHARGECYTPSPTPSPGPSLAAEFQYVVGDSPFQCGFTLPTESFATDGLRIEGAQWMDGADAAAAIRSGFSDDPSQGPDIGDPTGPVPVATIHFSGAVTDSGLRVQFGTADVSMDEILTSSANSATDWRASEGATYVGVLDGRVVATGTVPLDGSFNTRPVYMDWGGSPEDGTRIYLLDQAAALTSCDANAVDSASIDLYAVAGLIVVHPDGTVDGPTYAWLPVGKP